MGGSFGSESQLVARLLANADTGLAALRDEALEPLVLALAGDENVIEAAATSLEGFFNRVQAVENFHEDSLRGEGEAAGSCESPARSPKWGAERVKKLPLIRTRHPHPSKADLGAPFEERIGAIRRSAEPVSSGWGKSGCFVVDRAAVLGVDLQGEVCCFLSRRMVTWTGLP